jgi:hypothetical protein
LSIEERLTEEGTGPATAKPLTAAIMNRAAQRRGSVQISWDDVRPVLVNVCSFLAKHKHTDFMNAVKAVLTSHEMKDATDWVRNFSLYEEANATPEPDPKSQSSPVTP